MDIKDDWDGKLHSKEQVMTAILTAVLVIGSEYTKEKKGIKYYIKKYFLFWKK